MEALDGESLARRLERQGPFAWPRALAIGLQVCDALQASHAAGVIHRDLKPENVFLITRQGDPDYVKLLDFGVAKLTRSEAEGHRTRSGTVIGTPFYMSPEQSLGRAVDHRTDIYALGVMLYRMITGVVPFDAAGYGELLLLHNTAPFPDPRKRVPDLPSGVSRVIQRAVAKDKGDRWPDAASLRQALEEQLRTSARTAARVRRRPLAVWVGALSAILLGGAASTYRLTTGQRPTSGPDRGALAAPVPAPAEPPAAPAPAPVVTVPDPAPGAPAAATVPAADSSTENAQTATAPAATEPVAVPSDTSSTTIATTAPPVTRTPSSKARRPPGAANRAGRRPPPGSPGREILPVDIE
jgi:serine/threonine-protein kinase